MQLCIQEGLTHSFPRMSFILLPVKLMMRCAGCDCLGSIHYFDALMANSKGELSITHETLSPSVSRSNMTLRMSPDVAGACLAACTKL